MALSKKKRAEDRRRKVQETDEFQDCLSSFVKAIDEIGAELEKSGLLTSHSSLVSEIQKIIDIVEQDNFVDYNKAKMKQQIDIIIANFFKSFEKEAQEKYKKNEERKKLNKILKNVSLELGSHLIAFDELQEKYPHSQYKWVTYFGKKLKSMAQFFTDFVPKLKAKREEKHLLFSVVREMKAGASEIYLLEKELKKTENFEAKQPILVKLFNLNPDKAIKLLTKLLQNKIKNDYLKQGYFLLEGVPDAKIREEIVKFISNPEMEKVKVGEYISSLVAVGNKPKEEREACKEILKAYADTFDFEEKDLLTSLRIIATTFDLTSQKPIFQLNIIKPFIEKFYEQNGYNPYFGFKNSEAVQNLATSIILLNENAHNPDNKQKYTLEDFIKKNKGKNGGKDFPEDILKEIYREITVEGITPEKEKKPSQQTKF